MNELNVILKPSSALVLSDFTKVVEARPASTTLKCAIAFSSKFVFHNPQLELIFEEHLNFVKNLGQKSVKLPFELEV
ncbi:hypothetical protein WA1_20040 [Scytonema hofmannii PCC 7110]|uniref:Uncharacterized protein n=1 Tax=Scytonema hofmannii PCC 7110 TaxID=128403 RepID=A0A139XC47_9CYAN|nr:hypothetical protein WA1_20040 [Scytonema hofmannii PCC 7110]